MQWLAFRFHLRPAGQGRAQSRLFLLAMLPLCSPPGAPSRAHCRTQSRTSRRRRELARLDVSSWAHSLGGLEAYDTLLVLHHALDPGEFGIEAGALRIEQSKQICSTLLIGLLSDVGNCGAMFAKGLQGVYHFVASEVVFLGGAKIACPHFGLSLYQQLLLSTDFRGG